MNHTVPVRGLLLALAVTLYPSIAGAAPTVTSYLFEDITHSDAGAEADGETNLKVDVIDLGGNQVRFTFTNNSSSSLADVYFDDGALLGIASITSSAGVSFSQGASPPNLPGGNLVSPAFVTTAGFLADSDAPVPHNGVSMGEWLAIDFTLKPGQSYNSVINALALPNHGGDGDLRIGLHVQAYPGNANESYINIASPVPEPETYALFMAGLGLLGFMGRRRNAS